MSFQQNFELGEVVYIIIRNPHAQYVANVQQAAIVQDPDEPSKKALFVHDNYYPLSDEFTIFATEQEAESVYNDAFGTVEGEYYG